MKRLTMINFPHRNLKIQFNSHAKSTGFLFLYSIEHAKLRIQWKSKSPRRHKTISRYKELDIYYLLCHCHR